MLNPNLVVVGSVGGTPVQADVSGGLGSAVPIRVTLSQNYTLATPPGWPQRPFATGADQADLNFPRTLNAGQTYAFLKPEADAIVNGGYGSYA